MSGDTLRLVPVVNLETLGNETEPPITDGWDEAARPNSGYEFLLVDPTPEDQGGAA